MATGSVVSGRRVRYPFMMPALDPRGNAVRFVVLTVLIDAMGFGIVMPVLPNVVMALGHVGLAEPTRIGGWLGIVYALVQFATGPLVGNLGDRFGRRPVLLGSLAGFAIDYALLGFAPSLAWLFVGRALAGFFGASFGPAGAAMADLSAPEDRARHFGYISAAFGMGFILGPALGGLLGELGPRAPFHAAAALAGLNFLIGLVAFPETLAPAARRPFSLARANPLGALLSVRRHPGVLGAVFVGFWWILSNMVWPATWSYFSIAAFGWSPGLIGLSLAYYGLMLVLWQVFLVGRFVKALGERRAALVGIAGAIVGYLGFAVIRDGVLAYAWLMVTTVQSLVMPSLNGLMSRRMPADAQGELQGLNGSVSAVASILAPAFYNPALAAMTVPGGRHDFPGIVFVMAAASASVALFMLVRLAPAAPARAAT